jgi:hypothetical protein
VKGSDLAKTKGLKPISPVLHVAEKTEKGAHQAPSNFEKPSSRLDSPWDFLIIFNQDEGADDES